MRKLSVTSVVFAAILNQAVAFSNVTQSINNFVTKVDKVLTHNSELSSVLCPFNLHLGLSILHQGSGGNTAQDLSSLLGLQGGKQEVASSYKSLLDTLSGNSFKTWTCMIPGENFNLIQSFVEMAYNYFRAGSAGASQLIGGTDGDVTLKYCNNIGSRPKTTKLQLFSKAGFNSSWKKPFPPSEEGNFTLMSGEKIKFMMMKLDDYFPYKEDSYLRAQILRLDYKDEGWSMLLVLPNKIRSDISVVQKRISEFPLSDLIKNLRKARLELSLPKFNVNAFNFHRDMKFLEKMGAKSLFTEDADFSHVSAGSKMHLSHVLIEAFAAVNETGTLAGSGADFLAGGGDDLPQKESYQKDLTKSSPSNSNKNPKKGGLQKLIADFIVDRPFLFYILGPGNVFLYNGKIVNPKNPN